MAVPPTYSYHASASQIASSVLVDGTNSLFRYLGAAWGTYETSRFPALRTDSTNKTTGSLDFWYDGLEFELKLNSNQLAAAADVFIVYVNGERTQADTIHAKPVDVTATCWHKFTFATRARRHIRISLHGQLFWGIVREPTSTVYAATENPGNRVIICGDSVTEGLSTTGTLYTYSQALSEMLSTADVWNLGRGGMGWLAGTYPLRHWYSTDCLAKSPDVILISIGYNDAATKTPAEVQAEVTAVIADTRAACPSARLYITGAWNPDQTLIGQKLISDAIGAACSAEDVNFIDMFSWITGGTGKVGAPAGLGNRDYYIHTDGVHPSRDGHEYIAWRLANALRGYGE
jgi:lysophospholipase L1-like esterase